jgi:hypothetical protein
VALVTDSDVTEGFDKVIRVQRSNTENKRIYPDYQELLSFNNADRKMALQYTPWDETILIDTDFIPGTDHLPKLWDEQPLLISKTAHSLSNNPMGPEFQRLSQYGPPMYWATIIMFQKAAPLAKKFFQEWFEIQKYYTYFASLCGFEPELYRNDYAVSIALYRLFGGLAMPSVDLPYSIPTALPDLLVKEVEPIRLTEVGKIYSDVHVMHKKSLLEAICRVQGF